MPDNSFQDKSRRTVTGTGARKKALSDNASSRAGDCMVQRRACHSSLGARTTKRISRHTERMLHDIAKYIESVHNEPDCS